MGRVPRKRNPASQAGPPAPLPPRTPEEEALVQAHYGGKRLDRPPRFEKDKEGIRFTGDKELARARLGNLLHISTDKQLVTLTGRAGAAMGITDSVDTMDTLVGMVHGIGSRDHLEALLAMQMAAVHTTALEMLQRSHGELPTAAVDSCVARATRLMRTFTTQISALKDYRSKGHSAPAHLP
jgi:hypothetical protein